MRITWSLPVRGAGLAASRGDLVRANHLIDALRRAGHDVQVVGDAARSGSRVAIAGYRGIVRRLLPRRLAWVLRDAGRCMDARVHGVRVARTATEQGAELIVETQVGFAASGRVAAARTGLDLVLDDCSPSTEESFLGAGLPGLALRTLRQQVDAARIVVAVCTASRGALIAEGVPEHKLCIVPNGVDLSAFARARDGAARLRMRERLGASDGEPVLGFVGSFQPWHHAELLVEALSHIRHSSPPRAVFIGDGPGRHAVLAAARARGIETKVTASGAVPSAEIPTLLTAFDIGVLPGTNTYGHPMKLVEYAAAGLPSVAPDLQAVREEIVDGENGLLFPVGDAAALARVLTRLLDDADLARRLGRNARQRALQESWDHRARQLLDAAQGQRSSVHSGSGLARQAPAPVVTCRPPGPTSGGP